MFWKSLKLFSLGLFAMAALIGFVATVVVQIYSIISGKMFSPFDPPLMWMLLGVFPLWFVAFGIVRTNNKSHFFTNKTIARSYEAAPLVLRRLGPFLNVYAFSLFVVPLLLVLLEFIAPEHGALAFSLFFTAAPMMFYYMALLIFLSSIRTVE